MKTTVIVRTMLVLMVFVLVANGNVQRVAGSTIQQDNPPVMPVRIFGKVEVGNKPVSAKTEVTAWIDDKAYATANTTFANGASVYVLEVPGNKADPSKLDANSLNGKTITFKVNGVQTKESTVWRSGTLVELNLTAAKVTVIPMPTPTPRRSPISGPTRYARCTNYYFVKKGDTLLRIAAIFSVDYFKLAELNDIHDPNHIYVGQRICIPNIRAGNHQPPMYRNSLTYYTVKKGDTLVYIARTFGTSINVLLRANGINDPNNIYAGQVLRIP